MADETTGTAPEGTATPTTTTPADAGQTDGKKDEPLVNFREVVELRKETRAMQKQFAEVLDVLKRQGAATPVKADAKPDPGEDMAAQMASVRAELAESKWRAEMGEIFADLGIKAGPVRKVLEMAARNSKPEDLRAFVEEHYKALAPAGTPAPEAKKETPPPPAASPAGRSNMGAPSVGPTHALPDDPRLIPKETWASMDAKERRDRFEKWQRSQGVTGNPWRQRKEALGQKT